MDDVKNELAREPYAAPTIEDVPLLAEDRLLSGCKNSVTGNGQGIFPSNCVVTSCVAPNPS